MRARARVVAESDGRGGTRLPVLRSEAPLVLRNTPDAVYLVGGAGGPLGGDDLELDIEVGAGARLTLRTAAASIALPGPAAGPSTVHVRATVAAGGELRWLPEPVVAAQGSDHRMLATVILDGDAILVWREELILGRHGEAGGSVLASVRVDLDSSPLVRQELALGPRYPGCSGPAVTGGARAVGSALLIGPPWLGSAPSLLGSTGAVLPLARGGMQVTAIAADASGLRRQLDAGMRAPAAVT